MYQNSGNISDISSSFHDGPQRKSPLRYSPTPSRLMNVISSNPRFKFTLNFKPIPFPSYEQFKQLYIKPNIDGKYFTPFFVKNNFKQIQVDRQYRWFNEQLNKQRSPVTKLNCPIKFPVKSSGYSYCYVCRQKFTRYRMHILNIRHKKAIQKSQANKYITQLVKVYQQKNTEKTQNKKNKNRKNNKKRKRNKTKDQFKNNKGIKKPAK